MKRFLIFSIFSVFIVSNIFAQYKISGKVFDNEGNTLPGVTITLDSGQKSAVTNEFGAFSLENVHKGEYSIKAQYIGFDKDQKKINVVSNIRLDFYLKPSILNELDQVVVNATRSSQNTPFAHINIQKAEIEQNNIGQDIPYILQLTPSVVVSSDAGNGVGYTSMTIRGTDITRINVTLNGVPLNDPESHGVWWVDIPDFASSVNSIQIQRGVGTSTNGAGDFGASINLRTNKLNTKAYGVLSNSFGSFNTYKNTVNFGSGTLNKHFSFDGRLSRQHSDGYIDRARSDFKSFFFSATYFDDKNMLKANIFSGLENTYQAWYGVPKDSLLTNRTYNPYTYKNEIDYYVQSHYQLHYVRKINNNIKFNTSVFYVKGGGYYEQYKKSQSYSDYGLKPVVLPGNDTISETNLIRRKWLDNGFYGVNYNFFYQSDKLNIVFGGSSNYYAGNHFGKIIWMQYAATTAKGYQWYKNLGTKIDINNYLKANYELFNKFFVYSDIQFRQIKYIIKGIDDDLSNIDQQYVYPFFNPKMGFVFNPTDLQKIYASVAITHREPKRSDYIDAPTNKIPQPEELTDFELGYKLSAQNISFHANLYYMNYKNQLILTGEINDVGTAIVTNTPHSFRRGIELAMATRLFSFVNWNANLTLSQNKINNFTEYVDNWNYWDDPKNNPLQIKHNLGQTDISFSPAIIASNLLTFSISKHLKLDLISKYVGRQYIDNTSSIQRSLDPYFINDIFIRTEFKAKYIKKINLSIKINNILNEKYETNAWVYSYYYNNKRKEIDGYFPQATRNFLINLRLYF